MIYFILGAVVVGILWYRQTCINERKEHIQKWGIIQELGSEIIEELKDEYPRHQVLKNTNNDYSIHCKGDSHDFLVLFGYTPSGVYLRVDYKDKLGRSRVIETEMPPQEFGIDEVVTLMKRAINNVQ